jgi:Ni/Fe-hydrogenase subunit HybB-like protein
MPFKRKADVWLEGFCLIVLAVVATFDVGNYPELIEVIRYNIVLSVLGAGVCYFIYFCAMSRREAARKKSVNDMKPESELTQSLLQDGLYAANDEQQPYFSGENDKDILAGTRSDELLKHDL